MRHGRVITTLLGLGLALNLAARAHADGTSADGGLGAAGPGLDERVSALEQRLSLLSPLSGTASAFQGSPASAFASVDRGIGFISSDGNYGIQFSGTLQEDDRNYLYDGLNTVNNGKDYAQVQPGELVLARARLLIDAFLGPRVHVRIQEDFSNNGANSGSPGYTTAPTSGGAGAELVDAYGELRLLPWTLLRVGQFKTGLDIERWRQTPAEDFIQYSYTAGLVVDRAQGAELEVADPRQVFYLSGGAFDGDTDTGSNPVEQTYNSDKDAIARIFLQPFNSLSDPALGDLGLGVAASGGNHSGDPDQVYKSLGQLSIVNPDAGTVLGQTYTNYAEGAGYRVIPQAYWFLGRFSLLGEYAHETESWRLSTGQYDDDIVSEAWNAQAGWVITGEHAGYNGLKLNKRSRPWGALELVARVQGAHYDEGAFADYTNNASGESDFTGDNILDPRYSVESLTSWSVGLNYVPVSDVEFLLDWDRTAFVDGGQNNVYDASGHVIGSAVGDRPTEEVLQGRAQFAF